MSRTSNTACCNLFTDGVLKKKRQTSCRNWSTVGKFKLQTPDFLEYFNHMEAGMKTDLLMQTSSASRFESRNCRNGARILDTAS
jgi:hypothetical protein